MKQVSSCGRSSTPYGIMRRWFHRHRRLLPSLPPHTLPPAYFFFRICALFNLTQTAAIASKNSSTFLWLTVLHHFCQYNDFRVNRFKKIYKTQIAITIDRATCTILTRRGNRRGSLEFGGKARFFFIFPSFFFLCRYKDTFCVTFNRCCFPRF